MGKGWGVTFQANKKDMITKANGARTLGRKGGRIIIPI